MTHSLAASRVAIALGSVLALTLVGCSSSTGAAKSTTSSSSAELPAAKAAADAISTRPTKLSIGVKVTKPVPTGLTIATIDCGTDACKIIDNLISTEAAHLGWKSEEIQTDGTPAQIGNAWQKAIREKVSGITEAGASRSQIEPYIQQAKAAGIAVVLDAITDEPGNGVLSVIQGSESSGPQGVSLGAWVANDALQSGNPKASTLFVDLPDFKILAAIRTNYQSALTKYCAGCSTAVLNVGLTSLQQAPDQVTSYLRSHPSVKYVVFSVSNIFDAVPAAIKAAGLKVKLLGATPGDTTLTQLRAGQVTAEEAFPSYEEAYGILDAFVRNAAGVFTTEPPATYTIPQWMLTQQNAPSSNVFPIVANLVDQYRAAWGK